MSADGSRPRAGGRRGTRPRAVGRLAAAPPAEHERHRGGAIFLLIVAAAAVAPALAPHDPIRLNVAVSLEPPGARYWLGTDHPDGTSSAGSSTARGSPWPWGWWR